MKPAKGKHTVKPAQRIQALCEVRAILAVAAMQHWRDPAAPSYYNIAQLLGLPRESADLADEIWNAANGPDEGPETEVSVVRITWIHVSSPHPRQRSTAQFTRSTAHASPASAALHMWANWISLFAMAKLRRDSMAAVFVLFIDSV